MQNKINPHAGELRSAFPAALFFGVLGLSFLLHIFFVIGIEDFGSQVFVVALGAAFAGWVSTALLAACCAGWFSDQKLRRWALFFLGLGWYVPLAHAQPEPLFLSYSLFWLGFSFVVLDIQRRVGGLDVHAGKSYYVLAGVILGLAFRADPSVLAIELASLVWILKYGRLRRVGIASFFVGFLITLALGLLNRSLGFSFWFSMIGFSGRFFSDATENLRELMRVLHWVTASGLLVTVAFAIRVKPKLSLTWVSGAFIVWWIVVDRRPEVLFGIFPALPLTALLVIQASNWRPHEMVFRILAALNLVGLGLSYFVPHYF